MLHNLAAPPQIIDNEQFTPEGWEDIASLFNSVDTRGTLNNEWIIIW